MFYFHQEKQELDGYIKEYELLKAKNIHLKEMISLNMVQKIQFVSFQITKIYILKKKHNLKNSSEVNILINLQSFLIFIGSYYQYLYVN